MKNENLRRYALLLLLTPIFWWTLANAGKIIIGYTNFPNQTKNKVLGVYSENRLAYVEKFRYETHKKVGSDLLPRAYYNKVWIAADEAIGYFTFLSPRLYFQSGDGTYLSPSNIEPIPIVFFPLAVFGIFESIKLKNKRIIYFWLMSAFPAYLAGQKNFGYLFPTVLILLYFINKSLERITNKKRKKALFTFLIIYSSLLAGRALII